MASQPGTQTCGSCHTPHNDHGGPTLEKLLRSGTIRSGDAACYGCHGATAGTNPRGDLRVFEASGHATGVPVPTGYAQVVCLGCHLGHATKEPALVPLTGEDRCLSCHSVDRSLARAADIAGSLTSTDTSTRHDLLGADQVANGSMIACANCHEPHISSVTTPLVDPDNPTTSGGWSGTGVAFCLRCHDAALPTSAVTSGWAPAPLGPGGATSVSNIASSWPTNIHGEATSTPLYLRPDMAWAAGDPMTCGNCHEPHGSHNRYHLLETVRSKGATMSVSGLVVIPVGTGADMRFFCAACHIVGPTTHPGPGLGGADLTVFPIDCTAGGCHSHAGSRL
jgi:predicted CXXCH cytochrome family protein